MLRINLQKQINQIYSPDKFGILNNRRNKYKNCGYSQLP
jgi:hypothetical protein